MSATHHTTGDGGSGEGGGDEGTEWDERGGWRADGAKNLTSVGLLNTTLVNSSGVISREFVGVSVDTACTLSTRMTTRRARNNNEERDMTETEWEGERKRGE
jgi:hypothetical protein